MDAISKEKIMMPEYQEYFSTLRTAKSKKTVESYEVSLYSFFNFFKIKNIEDINNLNSTKIQNYLNILANNYVPKNENKKEFNENLNELIGNNRDNYSRLMQYKRIAKNAETAKASANTNASAIKRFLNWLRIKQYIEKSPFDESIKAFDTISTTKVFFDKDERDAIILACKRKLWLQATMALLFYTGLRRMEAVNLKRSDFHGNYVHALRKGNIEQDLYFPSFVGKLIQEYLDHRKDNSEYLLIGIRTYDKISEGSLNERVREACAMANMDEAIIKNVTAHTIRRSFACILYLDGKSTLAIQYCLNHASPEVTERYIEPAKKRMNQKIMSEQPNPSWFMEEEDNDE